MRVWPFVILAILFLWMHFALPSVVMWIIIVLLIAALGGLILFMWSKDLFFGPNVLKDHMVDSSKSILGTKESNDEEYVLLAENEIVDDKTNK